MANISKIKLPGSDTIYNVVDSNAIHKVSDATTGNIASLTTTGDIEDSRFAMEVVSVITPASPEYSTAEVIANKTQVIDSESTSVQYPSAKAVHDKLQSLEVVKYTEQSLTTEQKAQARSNICAGTISAINSVESDPANINADTLEGHHASYFATAAQVAEAVKYTQQILTTEQQTQARTNIGAGTYSKPNSGIPDSDLAEAHYTEAEADALLANKANEILTAIALPVTAVANTIYSLGIQSTITTTLPTGTKIGDIIVIVWYNDIIPAIVNIAGPILPFSITPTTNNQTTISALCDGTNWGLVSYEQAVS